ncbi:F-box/kelch-repeat protein-like protein [Tanacetum coccineum]
MSDNIPFEIQEEIMKRLPVKSLIPFPNHGSLLSIAPTLPNDPITNVAVIWNPTIRKSVDVVVPNVSDTVPYNTVVGFGEVEVFTLSSGVWRSPVSVDLPRNSIGLIEDGNVVIDGFIYWHAYDMFIMDGSPHWYGLIMSFNLTSEEFTEVNLPDSLSVAWSAVGLSISKLRDSLVVLRSSYKDDGSLFNCGVWMMENGDPKSFTKIFTITPPDDFVRMVLGFRKSGETIIEVIEEEHDALSVYEHYSVYSEHTNCIGFPGKKLTFFARCYMETLLLLDQ